MKPLSEKESQAVRIIRNFLMHRKRIPSVRELMTELGYSSPRSASVIIEKLLEKGILIRKKDGFQFMHSSHSDESRADTVDVPLVGSVACGMPILAEENVEAFISVSTKLARPPFSYFLLRAKGDSMNEAGIRDGDIVLVREQDSAHNGEKVVALIDDEATIKELCLTDGAILLKPKSSNPEHKPIILSRDFRIQGTVVSTISNF